MKKRIFIHTRNGAGVYGDYYEADDNSPQLHPSSAHTHQDMLEFVRASQKHNVTYDQYDYWKAIPFNEQNQENKIN